MTVGVPIPFHLAVHLLGLTVAAGLAVYAVARRHDAGAGWAGLALGGLLLATSHLIGGALIADDVAWPLYLRAAGYVGVAVGGAGRLLDGGTATVIAAAPTGAYLTAAAAGAAAAVASFRGVLGRRRDAVVLAAGIGLWAVSDLAALRAGSLLPGIVSIAGSLTLGGWLVWRSRETLLSRVVTSFLAALLVLLVGLGALGGVVFTSDLQRDAVVALQQSATGRAGQVTTDWTVEMLTTAKLFSRGTTLADRLAAGNRDVLQRSTAPAIAELPNVDVVLLLDPGGDLVASYDWGIENRGALPPSESLLLVGDDVVQRAVRGLESSGLVVLGASDVLAVGAEPVFAVTDGQAQRDRQVGVLAVGRRVTDPQYLEDVAATSGADATVVVGGSAASSTLGEGAADLAATIAAGERSGVATVDGEPTLLAAAPLGSPPATVAWLVLSEDAGTLAGAERALARTLFVAVLIGLLAAAVLAAWAASRTTRPLRRLTAAAERIAAGERDVRTGIDQPDEVGRLADAFDRMTSALVGRERELRSAAEVEAALRKRLEVLTASMGEGLVAVGADGAVQTINPAAQRLLGTSTDRAVGRPVSEVLVGVEE
ncbi:MAG TPA: HAMP domain-containing protein, partial [Nitriliruptorales bacterium]|nr:HAMP domain-containing protein [Nitriliruptorales bacterium]